VSFLRWNSMTEALLGSTPEERARVTMWNAKVEQQGLWAMAEAFRNSAKGLADRAVTGPDAYPQIPELAERDSLSETRFVAGDNYSIADITALVVVEFARWIKIATPDDAKNLSRWYAEVSGRPSAAV
jgi:glutathione S-transferase